MKFLPWVTSVAVGAALHLVAWSPALANSICISRDEVDATTVSGRVEWALADSGTLGGVPADSVDEGSLSSSGSVSPPSNRAGDAFEIPGGDVSTINARGAIAQVTVEVSTQDFQLVSHTSATTRFAGVLSFLATPVDSRVGLTASPLALAPKTAAIRHAFVPPADEPDRNRFSIAGVTLAGML